MLISYIKKLGLLLVLVHLVTVANASPMGTETGGGGDLTAPRPVGRFKLESFINEELSGLLGMFFNYSDPLDKTRDCLFAGFSGWTSTDGDLPTQLSMRACQKMFGSTRTVFAVLPNIKFVLQDPACVDPLTGADKDASLKGSTVCFSANRLLAKLNADNYQKSLIALAAHEVSHYLSTDEDEAQFIEGIAQRNIILTERFKVSNVQSEMQVKFDKIKTNIGLIESNSFSKVKNCILTKDIVTSFESIQRQIGVLQDHGFSFNNSANIVEFLAILIKAGNAETYCNAILASDEIDKNNLLNFIFKTGENEIQLSEYIKRLPGGAVTPNLNTAIGSVKRLDDGNTALLIEELKDLNVRMKKKYNLN